MRLHVDRRVLRVARTVARELMHDGAIAVVLTGSHVRDDAHTESDIDLIALLRRAPQSDALPVPIQRRGAFLVSSAWATRASVRAAFRDPGLVGTFVPGWREALLLEDPDGVAARLQRDALAWRWETIGSSCDPWVADRIAAWAEEVHKLAAALERGDATLAATQRSLLALHLAGVMAVHHRLLFGTENVLWDMVADAMGDEWRRTQRAALGMADESLEASCRAALRLYALAANSARDVLDRRQRAVVTHACELAGWSLEDAQRKGTPRGVP
jgi:hypothetical protein